MNNIFLVNRWSVCWSLVAAVALGGCSADAASLCERKKDLLAAESSTRQEATRLFNSGDRLAADKATFTADSYRKDATALDSEIALKGYQCNR